MPRRHSVRRRMDKVRNSSSNNSGDRSGSFRRNRDEKAPFWARALLKIFFYGMIMLFLKYKSKDNDSVVANDDNSVPSERKEKSKKIGVRTFVAGSGVQVYAVRNFLPHDLATKWRDIMSNEWRQQMSNENSGKGEDYSPWKYATNNAGSYNYDFNRKTRSLNDIMRRNETAQKMYQSGEFSYAKWELDHSHPLVSEIEKTIAGDEIRNRVVRIINKYASGVGPNQKVDSFSNELADLFVTHYWTGDFLSPHNDGFAGTWAFVLSLMEGPDEDDDQNQWAQDFGGTLRFTCPTKGGVPERIGGDTRWCEAIRPSFNTALLFRTRPMGPFHEVMPVSWRAAQEGYHRFAITGWYMDPSDAMNTEERAELGKMKAKDPIAPL